MAYSDLFIDVNDFPDNGYGFFQLIYLLVGYGLVVMYGAIMISDGSELLLLIPEWSEIIGTVVLPVLGAVPEGVVIMFSGIGPNAQQQIDVGIGTLVGSTVMLLTVPWSIAIFGGRVSMVDGKPNYEGSPRLQPGLSPIESLFSTGVALGRFVRIGAVIMICTSTTYLFIQIPGLVYYSKNAGATASKEQPWALAVFFIAALYFVCYMIYQVRVASSLEESAHGEKRDAVVGSAISSKVMTVLGALTMELRPSLAIQDCERSPLVASASNSSKHIRTILRPFFSRYDTAYAQSMALEDLPALLNDMGVVPREEALELFRRYDVSRSGRIDFEGFLQGMQALALHEAEGEGEGQADPPLFSQGAHRTDEEEEEEEEEEMPEDLRDLSPQQQQLRVKLRAAYSMGVGSLLVLLFADPLGDALAALATRLGVRPFYVAFVLVPLVSNGPELVATYNYSNKKTRKSISIALTTLLGAAAMNNTFALGVFGLLVFMQKLEWEYMAETLTVLAIQLVVGLYAFKSTHTLFDAAVLLSLYPLSLMLVGALESAGCN